MEITNKFAFVYEYKWELINQSAMAILYEYTSTNIALHIVIMFIVMYIM